MAEGAEVTVPAEAGENEERLVPVSEAIRYRRRAQAAEQELSELKQQLKAVQRDQEALQAKLQTTARDSELIQTLVQAGVNDLEVALLLGRERLRSAASSAEGNEEVDTRAVVEALRRERPELFGLQEKSGGAGLTSGVRPRETGSGTMLKRLAEQARRTGSEKDLQAYLRLRRSLMR